MKRKSRKFEDTAVSEDVQPVEEIVEEPKAPPVKEKSNLEKFLDQHRENMCSLKEDQEAEILMNQKQLWTIIRKSISVSDKAVFKSNWNTLLGYFKPGSDFYSTEDVYALTHSMDIGQDSIHLFQGLLHLLQSTASDRSKDLSIKGHGISLQSLFNNVEGTGVSSYAIDNISDYYQ